MTELTVLVNFDLFCHWLISLLRYSHDGFRARKGEEDYLQFLVVYSVYDQVGFVLPTYLKNIVSVPWTMSSHTHVLFLVIFSPMYWFHYQTSILSYTLPLFPKQCDFFFTILHRHILQWVDDLADAGADQYTFHLEATSEFSSLIPSSSTGGG